MSKQLGFNKFCFLNFIKEKKGFLCFIDAIFQREVAQKVFIFFMQLFEHFKHLRKFFKEKKNERTRYFYLYPLSLGLI